MDNKKYRILDMIFTTIIFVCALVAFILICVKFENKQLQTILIACADVIMVIFVIVKVVVFKKLSKQAKETK